MSTHHLSERDLSIYRQGIDEGKAFRHGSHLLHQDLFKAETPTHRIYIGYDDVDEGVYGSVTFKHRYRNDGEALKVELRFRSFGEALGRMTRFLAAAKQYEPCCTVDY